MAEVNMNQERITFKAGNSVQEREEQIRLKGKSIRVTSIKINMNIVIVTGKLVRTAKIRDEWYEDIEAPALLIEKIRKTKLNADILTFSQRLPEVRPKYNY